MHFIKIVLTLFIPFILGGLVGCSEPENEQVGTPLDPHKSNQIADKLQTYAAEKREEFLLETNKLQIQTGRFLGDPTEQQLNLLQEQWQRAHQSFSQAQFGLLTPPEGPNLVDSRIDPWPIQPGFIDDLEEYPFTGVVHDTTLSITPEMLIQQHQVTGSEEVLLGFHAIELLIFTRPIADFEASTSEWNDRRRKLLELMVAQFTQDVNQNAQASELLMISTQPPELINLFLDQTLVQLRSIFRESNLVAAQGSGHCLSRDCSLAILFEELSALKSYMVDEVGVVEAFKELDPATYDNFLKTIEDAPETILQSEQDEVALANVPLILSALTHQVEAFSNSLEGR